MPKLVQHRRQSSLERQRHCRANGAEGNERRASDPLRVALTRVVEVRDDSCEEVAVMRHQASGHTPEEERGRQPHFAEGVREQPDQCRRVRPHHVRGQPTKLTRQHRREARAHQPARHVISFGG